MEEKYFQKLLEIIERLANDRDVSQDGILERPFYYFEFNPNSTNKE